ncbi:MAG: cell envelope integrity protein CreD [Pseudomonadales bacterium]
MALSISSASSDRISLRFIIVAGLALALLVPLLLVGGVAEERQSYYQQVVADIAQSYGHGQTLVGPILVIPAYDRITEEDANGLTRVRSVATQHVVLPEQLQVTTKVQHQYRHRGIYQVPVYVADLELQGALPKIDVAAIESQHERVVWQDAFVALGISDTRAISNNSRFVLGERQFELSPGTGLDWLAHGVRVPLAQVYPDTSAADSKALAGGWQLAPSEQGPSYSAAEFSLALRLAGTEQLAVVPVGDQTQIEMLASWPHPKFEGNFLPLEYDISAEGFTARWAVSALARGVPQSFSARAERMGFVHQSAGVSLYEPVTQYTTVDRGLKYGVLFIALTFLAVLCFELLTGARLHLVQYGVIGLGLVLFYLVLLSLSEHLGFLIAYLLATGVIVLMLGAYARSVTRNITMGLGFALLQAVLYWILYVLLKLEDYALLTGTSVLVVGLAALMFVTRGLNRDSTEEI